jgi:hypothetical protein
MTDQPGQYWGIDVVATCYVCRRGIRAGEDVWVYPLPPDYLGRAREREVCEGCRDQIEADAGK